MADRKAELERKKAKLAAIREEKEKRRKIIEKELQDVEAVSNRNLKIGPKMDERMRLDRDLRELGISSVEHVFGKLKTDESGSGTNSESTSLGSVADLKNNRMGLSENCSSRSNITHRPVNLSVVNVHATNIYAKENVTYAKQTQTLQSGTDVIMPSRRAGGLDIYTLTYDEPEDMFEEDSLPEKRCYNQTCNISAFPGLGSRSPSNDSPSAFISKLPPGILPHGMPEVKEHRPAVSKEDQATDPDHTRQQNQPPTVAAPTLSENEKLTLMRTENFQKFFNHSTRLMERALAEECDVFIDYIGGYDDQEGCEAKRDCSRDLSLNRHFYDEKWTKNRVVTSLDWSTVYPELMVASYTQNRDAQNEPDGVCLIWNTRFKKDTPEHIFHCQSPVMASTFATFHPNLIVGGTYSGQIVLWDNRVQKRTPVQRSPLSEAAHTHPVYCVKVVGTQNAHNLISISTDSKMCSWSLDMLSMPQEMLILQQKPRKSVSITSLAFPHGDVNNFIVGSEEGAVFTGCRHGNRAGLLDIYDRHQAPVTGLHSHGGYGPIDFSHLFLTSSFDWTIKLWSLKDNKPLYSFEDNGDYVYDVAWSPVHPALFASVDGTGRLDLWNLNANTEVATASIMVKGCPALNRVSWTQSGLHVTVGDDFGRIWVFDVGESLALPSVSLAEESAKFVHTLNELKTSSSEDAISPSSSTSFNNFPIR